MEFPTVCSIVCIFRDPSIYLLTSRNSPGQNTRNYRRKSYARRNSRVTYKLFQITHPYWYGIFELDQSSSLSRENRYAANAFVRRRDGFSCSHVSRTRKIIPFKRVSHCSFPVYGVWAFEPCENFAIARGSCDQHGARIQCTECKLILFFLWLVSVQLCTD